MSTGLEETPEGEKSGIQVFSFGDPEPSMTRSRVIAFLEPSFDDYYDLPVPVQGLSEILNSNTHHSSALAVKRNLVVANFIDHKLLKQSDFSQFINDFLIFGNAYLERIKNRMGGNFQFKHAPSKFVRKHKKGSYGFIKKDDTMHPFKKDSIFHLLEPDINQEVYGTPYYMAAINSILLNESATVFRRRYYENGAHAGYIMYLSDPNINEADVDAFEEQIKKAKGPGNFKSLFVHSPGGAKDGLQIIHLSEAVAKDEFYNIKNISRDDTMTMHRTPPQLMAVVPSNTGGFGSAKDAQIIFEKNEIRPIQNSAKQFNEWAGEEIIRFRKFDWETDPE